MNAADNGTRVDQTKKSLGTSEVEGFHCYRPGEGHGLRHDPIMSIVAPRPIGWISTVSLDGIYNLAPYSFFNMFRASPPLLGFCGGDNKDSIRNASETGRFVWNLASRDLADAMNMTSATVSANVDEFALSGVTPCLSTLPSVPFVAESPVSCDCVVTQVIPLIGREGRNAGSTLVVGEIVFVRLADHTIVDGIFSTLRAAPINRAGGRGDYFGINEDAHFYMERPD
jgi:flavin reductase (DIM6/NTAB) family NADH-FMN oxidoreductase RutF